MRQVLRRAWYVLRHRRRDDELAEEMDFHRAMTQRAIEARGVNRAEAALAARRAFGSSALAADRARDVWIPQALQGFAQDFRLAARTMFANRLVSTVAILSLALGIGANTAIFQVVNSLLLRTLPVSDPARLVFVSDGFPTRLRVWTYPIWEEIHRRTALFESTSAWSFSRFNVATGGEKKLVEGLWASGSFFETLGVPAAVGRVFTDADDRRGGGADGPVVVISHSFWQRGFGGSADVIGRTLQLEGVPFTVVGVTPPDFSGPEVGRAFDVVVPLGTDPLIRGSETRLDNTGTSFLIVIGRLRPGQTMEAATNGLRNVQAEIREATIGDSLRKAGAAAVARYMTSRFTLTSAATGYSGLRAGYERPLFALLAIVGVLLIVACANIANLLVARGIARRGEISLRLALGASRWRIVRQFLAESAALSATGAALGILVASWSSRTLLRLISTSTSVVYLNLSLDGRVLAFTVAVSAMATILFGTAPALRASRVAPMDSLKQQGRTVSAGALGSWLVVAQVTLSIVLLVAAGLFVRTFASLTRRPLGFRPDQVLVVTMDALRTPIDPARRLPLFQRARDAVRSLPNVSDAALSFVTPFGNGLTPPIEVNGVQAGDRYSEVFGNLISPRWFSTLGMRLVAGRDLTEADRRGALRVAVVNETFASRLLGGANPIGRTITMFPQSAMTMPPMEIVGVVADAVYGSLRLPAPPTWYVPIDQFDLAGFPMPSVDLIVRSDSPATLTRSIVAQIAVVDPRLAVTFRPLSDRVSAALTQERLVAVLGGSFGVLALLLSSLGLYGVTAYAVSRRRCEIGIRMALGAAPSSVVRLVLSRVTMLVGLGVVIGAGVSLWASRFVASLLYGLEPRDPATLIGAAAVLATVGGLAAWLPARRASRVDPAIVLRYE